MRAPAAQPVTTNPVGYAHSVPLAVTVQLVPQIHLELEHVMQGTTVRWDRPTALEQVSVWLVISVQRDHRTVLVVANVVQVTTALRVRLHK